MSAAHSSSEDCPGHHPITDLLGNEAPSELLKNAAEVLGVKDITLLGLVLTYFISAAVESTDLGIAHLVVDNAVSGIVPVHLVAKAILEHAADAHESAERAAMFIAMAELAESLKARRN